MSMRPKVPALIRWDELKPAQRGLILRAAGLQHNGELRLLSWRELVPRLSPAEFTAVVRSNWRKALGSQGGGKA